MQMHLVQILKANVMQMNAIQTEIEKQNHVKSMKKKIWKTWLVNVMIASLGPFNFAQLNDT